MYLTEITYNGSNVLIMCVVGVWRHILDLWCVCVRAWKPQIKLFTSYSIPTCAKFYFRRTFRRVTTA